MKDAIRNRSRSLGLSLIPVLSWILPLGVLSAVPATASAQNPDVGGFATFSSYIADVDGDDVDDIAVADPYNAEAWPHGAAVEIYSGANLRFIRAIPAPHGDRFFGVSIVSSGDADADGSDDIAIASFVPNDRDLTADPIPVARIYSSRAGTPLIRVTMRSGGIAAHPRYDIRPIGDFDGDQVVTRKDLAMLAFDVSQGFVDKRDSDIDGDGFVDSNDIEALAHEVGIRRNLAVGRDLVSLVMTGRALVESRGWNGTHGPQAHQPTQAGFIGCAWCMFWCGAGMLAAADCVDQYNAWLRKCVEDAGSDAWELAECYRQRGTWIRKCIKKIGDAIPACAKCIPKCAPKPTL